MKELKKEKIALTVGVFVSGIHLGWIVLILTGFAQTLLNFVFWVHMLTVPYQITSFSLNQAITLILVTFATGYAMGWLFAWAWNYFHK